MLEVRYRCKTEEHLQNGSTSVVIKDEVVTVHLHQQKAFVHILPEEVAQNRKRRWSKKFPIVISWRENDTARTLYLFTPTSRDKEEWFRRLRHAAEGTTYDQIVQKLTEFYQYMGKYMPKANKKPRAETSSQKAQPRTTQTHSQSHHPKTSSSSHSKARHHSGKRSSSKHASASGAVKFSMTTEQDEEDDFVNISKMTPEQQRAIAARNRRAGSSEPQTQNSLQASSDVPRPTLPLGWITAGMARLVWDIWHEVRWKNWATSRIQRKLIRIKTPSFLEPLKVTEVHMGLDMPVIKRAHKPPKVDHRGVWVYLEVEYCGSFTMTIETKLKLTQKKEDIHFSSTSGTDDAAHSSRSPSPPPVSTSGHTLEPHHSTRHNRLAHLSHPKFSSDHDDEISSGSDDEGIGSSISSSSTTSLASLDKIPPELEVSETVCQDFVLLAMLALK